MNDYTFFLDPSNKSRKSTIYTADKLQIETSGVGCVSSAHDTFSITIDKHNVQNFIQIRFTNMKDKSKMYVCNIDDGRFENLKAEQAMHVSFDGFLKHLIQLLDNCRKTKLNVSLTMESNNNGQLQFYEKGTLKNLVHISLPIEPAPIELIMFALHQSYSTLQEANLLSVQKYSNLEMELSQKNERIERLNETIQRLKSDLNEQGLVAANRMKEQMARIEQEFKHISDSKDFQRQELEKQVTAYRARIDTLVAENHGHSEQLKSEMTTVTHLRNENKKLKDNLSNAKEQIEAMKNGQSAQRATAQKNDHLLNELRKQVQSLQSKLNMCEKQRSELMAELDAEKDICQIKRNGLKMATEDICNANSIIRKQAAEIAVLNEKIAWRTEVALKQEQVIRERSQENEKAKGLLEFVGGAVQNNVEQSEEIQNKLESLATKANMIEMKYHNRITEVLKEMPLFDQQANIRNY